MILFHLVKKDCLIIRKYIYLTLLVVAAIPLFFAWRAPQIPLFLAFLITGIFAELMLCQYLSMKETAYPKAAAMLCAAPYPRSALVIANYVFFVAVFVCSAVINGIETLLIPALGELPLLSVLTVFALISLIYGIYMPVQYQLGYEKTKYFFVIIIMASPFLLPTVFKSVDINSMLSAVSIPAVLQCILLTAAALLILSISAAASVRIYSKKELL